MNKSNRVVYVGSEAVFQGLKGTLVELTDRTTSRLRLHFQPESSGIQPVPCELEDVRVIERPLAVELPELP